MPLRTGGIGLSASRCWPRWIGPNFVSKQFGRPKLKFNPGTRQWRRLAASVFCELQELVALPLCKKLPRPKATLTAPNPRRGSACCPAPAVPAPGRARA